tara:strand:- start:815 stop:955 length:141 start_codon:yes stop_codon:yes gene_type:complete
MNPFSDCDLEELAEAYEEFSYIEDTEAVALIVEVFCEKLDIKIKMK